MGDKHLSDLLVGSVLKKRPIKLTKTITTTITITINSIDIF